MGDEPRRSARLRSSKASGPPSVDSSVVESVGAGRKRQGQLRYTEEEIEEWRFSQTEIAGPYAPKVARSASGRGGSHDVGLSQARRELREGYPYSDEEEDGDESASGGEDEGDRENKSLSTKELVSKAQDEARALYMAVKSSKNLKGTHVRAIKEATVGMMDIVCEMGDRAESEEVQRLRAINQKLMAKIAKVDEQMKLLKKEISQLKQAKAAPAEEVRTKDAAKEKPPQSPAESSASLESMELTS
ncbi:hypothetical protein ACJJTC_018663 [Scirpophaga incertulas]